MNSLRPVEINLIQKVFEGHDGPGWVLDFTNQTFKEFFDLAALIHRIGSERLAGVA